MTRLFTPLCELLGIELPLIQAPMAGGVSTPALVAAVSQAGALGSFGFAYTEPEAMRAQAELVTARTQRPYAINLFAAPPLTEIDEATRVAALEAVAAYYDELGLSPPQPPAPPYQPDLAAQLDALEAIRPAVCTLNLGSIGAGRIGALQARGIRVGGSATCVAEAKDLESLGADFIIAQGAEAGGHRGTYLRDPAELMTGTLALTRLLVKAVRVPVVAAGGIMDGAGIAAALALGAQGAQLGTAFLTCAESGASSVHKNAVLAARDDETLLTAKLSGRLARTLTNRYVREMNQRDAPCLPFPAQNMLTGPLRAAAARRGIADFATLWAGQAAPLARELPAAELVHVLCAETLEAIERLAGLSRTAPASAGTPRESAS
jgi:nitronate monooxygenase